MGLQGSRRVLVHYQPQCTVPERLVPRANVTTVTLIDYPDNNACHHCDDEVDNRC